MELEKIIKKLEETRTPRIVLPSHRLKLKNALINWKYQEKPAPFWTYQQNWIRAGAAFALVMVFLVVGSMVAPQYILAKAKDAALKNPKIKEWVAKGAQIKDVKIVKNKAYVLISPKSISFSAKVNGDAEDFTGAIAEIPVFGDQVSNIESIKPEAPSLTQKDIDEATQIVKENESPGKSALKNQSSLQLSAPQASQNITIEKVESLALPAAKLRINKKNNTVEPAPQTSGQKKVITRYRIDGERKETLINISKGEVEDTQIIERNSENSPTTTPKKPQLENQNTPNGQKPDTENESE